jgi:transposase
LKFFPGARGLLIDSSALPSSINASLNAFGYASGSIEENVSCLMLIDKKTSLPIYFRAIGGDIADISTVETTISEIKKLGLEAGSAILDAGFCSKSNLEFMYKSNIDFITRLPKSHNIFANIVKEVGNIESSRNAVKYGDRIVFIKSQKKEVYGNDIYVHTIFDPSKRNKDLKHILQNNLSDGDAQIKERVVKEEVVKKLEQEKLEQEKLEQEKLEQARMNELDEKIKEAGYFILLSKAEITKDQILPSYYERQKIEQIFGFAKSNNNLLPLRVHSDQSIRGYLMLVFLALIVFIQMRQKLQMPMNQILIQLRSLKAKVFDDEIIIQEPNKKVKEIFKKLGIIMPTKLGV